MDKRGRVEYFSTYFKKIAKLRKLFQCSARIFNYAEDLSHCNASCVWKYTILLMLEI